MYLHNIICFIQVNEYQIKFLILQIYSKFINLINLNHFFQFESYHNISKILVIVNDIL